MRYEEFEQLIQDDLSWRKKEITELYLVICDKKNEVLMKSIILILYAHWEGYIKKSSKLYIKYISDKGIKISELTTNFKAVFLKTNISNTIDVREKLNLSKELEFMNKYEKIQGKKFSVSIDLDNELESDIINTHDNLNPKVFKNILNILGIKYMDSFISREHYINSSLLGNRNAIGHGSKFNKDRQAEFDLSIEHIGELKTFIIQALDLYRDVILDYILDEFYLKSNTTKRSEYDEKKNIEFNKVLRQIEEEFGTGNAS